MYPLVICYVAMENRLFMHIRDSTVLNYQLVNDSFKLDCAIFFYHFQTGFSDPIIPKRIFQPWLGWEGLIHPRDFAAAGAEPSQCGAVPRSGAAKR